ncbi:response regulator transcription factor [Streptomyces argenteolus]
MSVKSGNVPSTSWLTAPRPYDRPHRPRPGGRRPAGRGRRPEHRRGPPDGCGRPLRGGGPAAGNRAAPWFTSPGWGAGCAAGPPPRPPCVRPGRSSPGSGARPWLDLTAAEPAVPRDERRTAAGKSPAAPPLTEAELRLARLVCEGAGNQEAAARLFLSVKTVEARLTRIHQKLGVRSRARLAAALRHS